MLCLPFNLSAQSIVACVLNFGMPPKMIALKRKIGLMHALSILRLLIITVGGMDVDIRSLVNSRRFIEDNYIGGLCFMKRVAH